MTYEEAKEEVAKKHKLGKTLVIGHRPAYYEEAAMLFTKFHVEAALKGASEKAEIVNKAKFSGDYNPVVDEDSILNAYPLELIK